jgi:hypothetical protein
LGFRGLRGGVGRTYEAKWQDVGIAAALIEFTLERN